MYGVIRCRLRRLKFNTSLTTHVGRKLDPEWTGKLVRRKLASAGQSFTLNCA